MSTQPKPLFAFFGTPHFSVVVLDALERHGLLPALVITTGEKARGRGLTMAKSPVHEWAVARNIDVLTPSSLKDEAFVAELKNTEWDVFVLAAYAKLIPKEILEIPRRGTLNVHPSLLPKLRGPSPARSAILEDMRQSGVTIMEMDEALDHGAIVAQARIEISEEEWPPMGSMYEDLLATEGGNLLAEVMPEWVAGKIESTPQDETQVTYSRKFSDEDAKIDLSADARENFLKIRAFDSSPRAYFVSPRGKRVIIKGAEWKDGELLITRVLPEGKKEMSYEDYLRGQR